MRTWRFEDGGFLALILLITFAFAWLAAPFLGAILWGVIAGLLFAPVYRRLLAWFGGRENLAAAVCLLLILALVITPAFLLGVSLISEAAAIYEKLQSGEIDFGKFFGQISKALPDWGDSLLASYGLTDMEAAREMVGSSATRIVQSIASRALWFGQGALDLLASLGIMLYLTFFLLRDGEELGQRVKAGIPLRSDVRDALIHHFIVVIRATMRGTVVVSILQGVVGGIIFWMLGIEAAILWGLLMALFSLFPAVGTGVVWVPVAIYLLVTGSTTEGIILVFCGLFIIGLIDNILRPVLVGHEAHIPEFVVLIATIAGLRLMGLNGVIIGPIIAALFLAAWKIATEWRDGFGIEEEEAET